MCNIYIIIYIYIYMYSLEACLTNADFTLDLMAATLSPGSSSSYIWHKPNSWQSHVTTYHHTPFKNMDEWSDVHEILIKIGIKLKWLLNTWADNNRFFRLFNTIQLPLSVSGFHSWKVWRTSSLCYKQRHHDCPWSAALSALERPTYALRSH